MMRSSTARTASVSIVIPAYNEEDTIERCLRAALDQSVTALEIIVVDNRSTDRTAEIVLAFAATSTVPIRIVQQTRTQGITATRNFGFDLAAGEVIGRIDADSVITRDWVERVAKAMQDPRTAAVSGPVTYYDLPFRFAPQVSDDLVRRVLRVVGRSHPFLFGCNMAIRRDAWRAVEQVVCEDPGDRMHEDIDLAIHLRDAGARVAYSSRLRAHVSARRLSGPADDFLDYARRFERTYRWHGLGHRVGLQAAQSVVQGSYWFARALSHIVPVGVDVPLGLQLEARGRRAAA